MEFGPQILDMIDKIKRHWHSLQDVPTPAGRKCAKFYNKSWVTLVRAKITKDKKRQKAYVKKARTLLKSAVACEKKMGGGPLTMRFEEINFSLREAVRLLSEDFNG